MASSLLNPAARAQAAWDVTAVRRDFPALEQTVHGHPLVYLDNAATTQKPRPVLEKMLAFYQQDCGNIHRSIHQLGERATEAYEKARLRTQAFLGAGSAHEIVFVRGATEAINLVAQTFGRQRVGAGDRVLITELEHHSNIVPWQMLCEEKGAHLDVAPIDDAGELIWEEFIARLTPRTRLAAFAHVSNALGTVLPVRRMIEAAHAQNIPVLVDGAQAAPHLAVNVRELDADFYVFSGHKVYGPTGIGALYGKRELLEEMPPWQGGGDMIQSVSFARTIYNRVPYKFEAGTPHIAGAIGLKAALDYVSTLGLAAAGAHEDHLLRLGTERLGALPGLRLIGQAREKLGVLSFTLAGIHPHDVATLLDQQGIAVRAGHHCAQPVMEHYHVPATTRASLALYNTEAEIEALARGIEQVQKIFQ